MQNPARTLMSCRTQVSAVEGHWPPSWGREESTRGGSVRAGCLSEDYNGVLRLFAGTEEAWKPFF